MKMVSTFSGEDSHLVATAPKWPGEARRYALLVRGDI